MSTSRPSTYFIEFTSPRGTKLFVASPAGTSTTDATAAYQFKSAADALEAFSMILPQARSKLLPGCKVRSRALRHHEPVPAQRRGLAEDWLALA